jgi:hypothetical protein
MKLNLPEVTLVMVETREHELARLAIQDCIDKADFGDLIIVTDRPSEFYNFNYLKPKVKTVPDWPSKLGWSRSWWYDIPPMVSTSHTLNIQWDSWIWDTSMWREDYLRYDYIGAPWWYKDGKNVGNGGFSLVSTRLKRYLYDHRQKFPCNTHIDDDLLCRKYRFQLEQTGFIWAPERIAHEFAFECCRPSEISRHFGFHAMFNWPVVLDKEDLFARLEIAASSEYIRDSYMMKAFSEKYPELIRELVSRNQLQAAE